MNMTAVETHVRQIVAAFNAGRQAEALRLCEAAIAQNPADPILNHIHAQSAFAVRDYAVALEAAERSLAARPDNAATRLLAGRAARALGNPNAAEQHFRRLPASPGEAGVELARTLDISGKRQPARDAWLAVRRADPSSREAAARLGRLAWEDGAFEEARHLLEFACQEQAPASAWFDLGLARQDCGDLEGAASAFQSALSGNPDDAEAAFNLGAALQELGDIDGAVSAYQAAYRVSPSTLGMITNALTSGSTGRMFIDKDALKVFLGG
jgi:tetratricopeptide (TPR) repeat protein